jgi:ADP-ribosylation factor 2-binding protein
VVSVVLPFTSVDSFQSVMTRAHPFPSLLSTPSRRTGDGDGSEDDNAFDEIVGALENILMDDDFLALQNDFCVTNSEVFTDDDENKLVYTTLFTQYTEMIEGYIAARLGDEIEGFTMERLGDLLSSRTEEITGDVFDMLMSFTDFDEFKSLMLSHKADGEGTTFDGMLGIVSKEGNAAVGSEVLGYSSPAKSRKQPSGEAEKKVAALDVLSPNSREAKNSGMSP